MALPMSEGSLVAILLEDVLILLREALVRVAIRVVVVGKMKWMLEGMESREKGRSAMMTIRNEGQTILDYLQERTMQLL